MEFEKIALSTLLYKFPVEEIVNLISERYNIRDNFMSLFSKVARWENSAFTESEMDMLQRLVEEDWLKSGNQQTDKCSALSRINWMLLKISNQLLTIGEEGKPLVKFEQLFRWREMTIIAGEDLLTTAFLAGFNSKHDRQSIPPLDWPDILRHDHKEINTLLDNGMADVHAHFSASGNVFEINWINLMNHFRDVYHEDQLEYLQMPLLSIRDSNLRFSYKNLTVAAAFLRFYLFKLVDGMDEAVTNKLHDVLKILKDRSFCQFIESDLQEEINVCRCSAIKDYKGHTLDYALIKKCNTEYGILCGERYFLYQFLYGLYAHSGIIQTAAPYFYLYLLIKSKIRREIIETNGLGGLKNFQTYQKRKGVFIFDKKEFNTNLCPKYIVQSCLEGSNNKLEARVCSNAFSEIGKWQVEKNIFDSNETIELNDRFTIVVHLLKSSNDTQLNQNETERFSTFRRKQKKEIDTLLKEIKTCGHSIKLTGIDAAGNELLCRPEVFAHIYRYAKCVGLTNQTYHVGEDFFDLVDGLRAIDESIRFLALDKYCRLGHALALGTNASQYYERRHYRMILPQQYYLDNLVWLFQNIRKYDIQAPSSFLYHIENELFRIYSEIGYKPPFDILSYWHSMLLRGDELNTLTGNKEIGFDAWAQTDCCESEEVKDARLNNTAIMLYSQYLKDKTIKEKGQLSLSARWNVCISPVLTQIQEKIMATIAEKHIAIECNPSSNVMIGSFQRYEEHPLFRFMPIENKPHTSSINVSINTDDRGIFQTSLQNEYSLIALSVKKMKEGSTSKWNDEMVLSYLEKLRNNSLNQCFKPIQYYLNQMTNSPTGY